MYNYAEETLDRVDDKIVQVEATLDLLECKLSSIPADASGDSQSQISVVQTSSIIQHAESSAAPQLPSAIPAPNMDVPQPPPMDGAAAKKEEKKGNPEEEKEKQRAELYKDENVKVFARMLKFGVPDGAITGKMKAQGYDPSLLDVCVRTANGLIENCGDRGQAHYRVIMCFALSTAMFTL